MRITHQLRQLDIRLDETREVFLRIFASGAFGVNLAQEGEVAGAGRRTGLGRVGEAAKA